MARAGIGEPFFVTHPKYSDTVTAKFRKYISTPVLTDIKIDFNGFSAYDVEPKNIPDVSEQRPIIIYGKWNGSAQGSIRISGRNDEQELQVEVPVKLFAGDESNDALKYLWARNKIAELSDYIAIREDTATVKAVTEIGMKYNLLTKYTSFVAVDYEIRNNGKDLIKVNQPLPLPEGVSDQAIGDAGMSANAFSPSPSGYGVGRSLSYSSMKKVGKFYSGVVSAEVDEVQVIDDSNIIDLKAAELTKINAEFKGFLVYPPKVIEKGIDGKVVLWVLLDKTGYPVYTEMVETVSGGLYVAAMNALSKVNLLPVKQVTSDTYFWRKFEINFDLEKKSADIIDISEDILFDATIQSVDLKNGTGEPINDGDTVVINYTSVSSDCSILENQEKNTIVYGERSINRAITGILTGMSVGGRRKASVTELYFAPENYATIIQKQLKINLEIEVIEIRRKKSE
jgi:hypothetical protein